MNEKSLNETGESSTRVPVSADDPGALEPVSPSSARLIKWSSRIGAWGLAGAFVPVIAFSLGAPIPLTMTIGWMAGGFILGGLSTSVASYLVNRSCPTDARTLRVASLLGMPLGLLFAGVGASTYLGWQIVSSVGGLTMAGLGILVLVLLITGFFMNWQTDEKNEVL